MHSAFPNFGRVTTFESNTGHVWLFRAPTIDADIDFDGGYKRRFPQLILRGSFNKWGYDEGIPGLFSPRNENMTIDVITSWPHEFQLAVFEARDKVFYGDVDNDGVLDLLPPNSQARNFLSLPPPAEPFLGQAQSIWFSTAEQKHISSIPTHSQINQKCSIIVQIETRGRHASGWFEQRKSQVKIGGLGVMSSLMGKAMDDLDLLWVYLKSVVRTTRKPIPPLLFQSLYSVDVPSRVPNSQVQQYNVLSARFTGLSR
ncbi:hypothetical protein KEM48_004087 [Puccinia striiformis f. sp. tritici PST-130]|nr:hypothetical protein KEM48_004087 [Puccinia striiformis f. sp. tritici PST-130]